MKVLIASDKFKGSLSALEIGLSIEKGIIQKNPSIVTSVRPMADGGDGSLSVLDQYLLCDKIQVKTKNPKGAEIIAYYLRNANTAYIELAQASGIVLLEQKDRNPMYTDTIGTGELILHAIAHGCNEIFLFLGGSSTNDAGIGIAYALGFRFLDKEGISLFPYGASLIHIKEIVSPAFDYSNVSFYMVTDVKHTLYGPGGAAHTFAPQKGANSREIESLDRGLINFEQVLVSQGYPRIGRIIGGGSAGGISAGLSALIHAKIIPGTQYFLGLTQIKNDIQSFDLVVSGEGKIDASSLQGKVIHGMLQLCEKHAIPLLLICGKNELHQFPELVKHCYAISDLANNEKEAMQNTASYLQEIGRHIAHSIQSSHLE